MPIEGEQRSSEAQAAQSGRRLSQDVSFPGVSQKPATEKPASEVLPADAITAQLPRVTADQLQRAITQAIKPE